MDILLWLIVVAVAIVVLAFVFVLFRKRQRNGGVLASGPVTGGSERSSS